jgi:hypothetical protein
MLPWLVHHWIGLSGAGLGLWPVRRVCRFFQVRRFVLEGDSWTLKYRRRNDSDDD